MTRMTVDELHLFMGEALHIDFFRKPPPDDLLADCILLKVGRRLAVGDVKVRSVAGDLVASASVTYSIPPGSTR